MSTVFTSGIVLRQSPYNDFDRQYVIYTRDWGKVLAVAKGGQKTISKLSPHLGGFFVTDLMLARGASFYRIAASSIAKNFSSSALDLEKIVLADYVRELIDKTIRFDYNDPVIFDLLTDFLADLAAISGRRQALLLFNTAVFDLLSRLGYCPVIKSVKSQRQLFRILTDLAIQVAETDIRSKKLVGKLFT